MENVGDIEEEQEVVEMKIDGLNQMFCDIC